jgi:hypothetical protein
VEKPDYVLELTKEEAKIVSFAIDNLFNDLDDHLDGYPNPRKARKAFDSVVQKLSKLRLYATD